MAATLNIFEPTISTVSKGIEGKLVLLHSNERKLGKTYQATRFPKPYYLRFEQGINAIAGLAYAPLKKWSDFKKINKQLTDPKTVEKARQMYSTIIVDTTDVAIKWCEKYVCASQGVTRLNDGNSGFGLWKEYENEWFNEWNKLLNAGYCVVFIAHSEVRKLKNPVTKEEYEQLYPKGDKRTIDLIIDAADFIGYVKSNGFDENGELQMSSVYFSACPEFLAGSRFTYMAKEVTPFTAEGVQEAMKQAIEQEEAEKGITAISYDEKVAEETVEEISFEDALRVAKIYGKVLVKVEKNKDNTPIKDKALAILEKYLGEGAKLDEAIPEQVEQVTLIMTELQELAEEYDIEVEV